MMKGIVLVAGGAGYIGSHVCKALAEAGYEPVVYDNFSTGYRDFVQWGPVVEGDILDAALVAETARRFKVSAAMNFAGLIAVGESVEKPLAYYRNNVAGLVGYVDGLTRAGVDRLVFSSTAAVYGTPLSTPIDEAHRKAPTSPYGHSKLMGEQVLADAGIAHGLRSVCLRYFNAAGGDPEGSIGEAHAPETHLIPIVLEVAAGKRAQLKLFGDDYDTPDGTCIRDYIHVCDLADAHIRAMEWAESQPQGTAAAFNLGIGHGFSVREVIEIAEQVTGCPIPFDIAPRRAGDPAILVAAANQAEKILGWQPRYRDVATQIQHAWDWVRSGKADRLRQGKAAG